MRMGFLFHLGLLSALVAVVAMAFDYLTGYLGAYKDNTVQSGKMREGLWHKGGFLGIMLLSVLVEIGTESARSTTWRISEWRASRGRFPTSPPWLL